MNTTSRYLFTLHSCLFIIAAFSLLPHHARAEGSDRVTLVQLDDKIRVEIGGKLFTEYLYRDYDRPILYPIIGPFNIAMTRNYPMKRLVQGEGTDHIHHKSLWFAHGDVNGVDFWTEGPGRGHIVHDKLLNIEHQQNCATILTSNVWVNANGEAICRDQTKLVFSVLPAGRIIDWTTTILASEGKIVFGDTKEGTMAIRTHPNLRLSNTPEDGVVSANGQAVNSEGIDGQPIWGKRAKWVDYWGQISGNTVGIAIMDHPSNPRHPTWWQAREYGLVAANPFGIHDFEDRPAGTGKLILPARQSLTFRYRFLFHEGNTRQAKIVELYEQFGKTLRER